ncbi:exonuclease RecJ, partial [Halolamina litorea]
AAGETVRAADAALDAAREAGLLDREPGLSVPSVARAADLGASTLLHGPASGDGEAAADVVAELDPADEEFGRRLASLVTLDAVTADGATERAAERIERALRPYRTPDAPFATLGGYADVLDATARTAPGTGIALVLGEQSETAVDAALEAWRAYGDSVHRALRTAETARHRGVWVLSLEDADPAVLPA